MLPAQHCGLTYDTNQDAFLGGYEAAATSKTGVVATYGGMQFPSVTIYMDGFAEGVAYFNAHKPQVRKTVKLLGWNEDRRPGPSSAASRTRPRRDRLDRLPHGRRVNDLPGRRR